LHDHGQAASMLDASAAWRERNRMDVTPNHGVVP
jgi:hypothetical protein